MTQTIEIEIRENEFGILHKQIIRCGKVKLLSKIFFASLFFYLFLGLSLLLCVWA